MSWVSAATTVGTGATTSQHSKGIFKHCQTTRKRRTTCELAQRVDVTVHGFAPMFEKTSLEAVPLVAGSTPAQWKFKHVASRL